MGRIFMNVDFEIEKFVKDFIKDCQFNSHIQQVAYSTYHNCLTQICFTCKVVRTSISKDDVIVENHEEESKDEN